MSIFVLHRSLNEIVQFREAIQEPELGWQTALCHIKTTHVVNVLNTSCKTLYLTTVLTCLLNKALIYKMHVFPKLFDISTYKLIHRTRLVAF